MLSVQIIESICSQVTTSKIVTLEKDTANPEATEHLDNFLAGPPDFVNCTHIPPQRFLISKLY